MAQGITGRGREILRADNLMKRFGGITAVDNVSSSIDRGELIGIIGPNGAGKTTLFNLLTGFEKPDSGHVYFLGKEITRAKPEDRVEMGMARTFQIVRPFKELTVWDSIKVVRYTPRIFRRGDEPDEERIKGIIRMVGLEGREDTKAKLLTHGELKKLEIARALALEPELLMLDEPFGGLTAEEVNVLSGAIKGFHEEGGTVMIIEHRLRELMRLVERVIVMSEGSVIYEGRPQETVKAKVVIEAYLGRRVGMLASGQRA